jgi:hypothetical protein
MREPVLHVDRLDGEVGRAVRRTVLHADAAPRAVLDVDLQREARLWIAARVDGRGLEGRRRVREPALIVVLGSNHAVRADDRALAALDAEVGVPDRYLVGDIPFLEPGRAGWVRAVHGKRADGKHVAAECEDGRDHVAHEVRRRIRDEREAQALAGRLCRDANLVQVRHGAVDRGKVLLDDRFSLLRVRFFRRALDRLDGLVARHHARQREEAGLQDRVHAGAQAEARRHAGRIDDVELEFLFDDLLLHVPRDLVPDVVGPVGAVDEHRGARRGCRERVELVEKIELVDADEVRRLQQIRRADRPRAEPQVRDRVGAGLLGVVDEVALCMAFGVRGQDLRRVLVRADGAVGAQAEEQRAHHVRRLDVKARIDGQAGVRHVVGDPDREPAFRLRLLQLVEYRLGHRGIEILRGQAVAAAHDHGH